DSTAQKIFAFTGNDGTAGASAAVVQMNENLSGIVRVHVGLGSVGNTATNANLHLGTPDNNYFGIAPSTGHLFLCGTGPADTSPYTYWLGFSAYPVMNANATQGPQRTSPPIAGAQCSPFSEFFNPNINLNMNPNDHDLLASSILDPVNGLLGTNDISN